MEKTYTIEQIRTYLNNVDSFGDAHYFLDKIDNVLEEAERKKEEIESEGLAPDED